jgi:hypothetical protein
MRLDQALLMVVLMVVALNKSTTPDTGGIEVKLRVLLFTIARPPVQGEEALVMYTRSPAFSLLAIALKYPDVHTVDSESVVT